MNPLRYLFLFLCIALVTACGNNETSSARQAPINTQTAPAPAAPAPAPAATTPAPAAATTPPPPAEPAQNAAGVWHYTCSNGCAGGAGSAVACATCGNTLAHNQAYHGQSTTTPTAAGAPVPTAGGTPSTMFADPSQPAVNATVGAAPAPIQTAEPAQNAAGVWHYTCGNGCSGGGGSATACAQCGATLAHNQAYHQ